jgi:hypothetical protein
LSAVSILFPVHLLAVAACLAGDVSRSDCIVPPIFREVRVVGDTIRLGQAWPGSTRLGIGARDTVAELPTHAFGWAEGIRVHRDQAGIVREMDFTYGPKRDIVALLRDYRTSLGRPVESRAVNDGRGRRETWVWRDGRTELTVVRFLPARNGVQARSILVDRLRR